MKDLRIVFINHRQLNKRLRSLRGKVLQGKEEFHARLDKMHRSLRNNLQYLKQQQIAEALDEAHIFQMNRTGFHPHLLLSDPNE